MGQKSYSKSAPSQPQRGSTKTAAATNDDWDSWGTDAGWGGTSSQAATTQSAARRGNSVETSDAGGGGGWDNDEWASIDGKK